MTKKVKIIIIAIFAAAILVVAGLSTALGIIETKRKDTVGRLHAVYEKSYFEAMDSISDIQLRLTKIIILSGSTLKRQLLGDVWRECDVAATNMSQLGTQTEEMNSIIKFLNQLGDYSYFLSMRLKTEALDEKEIANLKKLSEIVTALNNGLLASHEKLITGSKIETGILADASLINDAIKAHSSVEYPELIYDGPFSDGLNDREAKFLKGKEEITSERGVSLISEYFPESKNVEYIGEGTTSIPTYLYQFDLGRNTGTAQISKVGGYLAMYNAYCEITDPTLDEDACVEKAKTFLTAVGFDSMKKVYLSNNNSTVYINFAYEKDGVVLYPDLIKIKVCSQTGDIIGFESQNFLLNHIDRALEKPSEKTFVIDKNLTVLSQTYCLIPTEWNSEILCKEVIAEGGGITYYLYYDLETGEEHRVMVEIDADGKLLM